MNFPSIVIPDLATGFGNTVLIDSKNGICWGLKMPRWGLTNGKRSPRKRKSGLQFCGCQMVMSFIQPSDALEGSQSHKRIKIWRIHRVGLGALVTI